MHHRSSKCTPRLSRIPLQSASAQPGVSAVTGPDMPEGKSEGDLAADVVERSAGEYEGDEVGCE